MLFALLLLAAPADWVPARWLSNDPKSLELLATTPINCVLLEEQHWSAEFSTAAARKEIATLGVIRPGSRLTGIHQRARAAGLTGVVLEGIFDKDALAGVRSAVLDSQLALVELAPRTGMRFDTDAPVVGTFQGVWPGINQAEDGTVKAAPSGAPWIDTNGGFLRFARALTNAEIWVAFQPPSGRVIPLARYMQAIGDPAILGARWVVELDSDFWKRLLEGEAGARRDWEAMGTMMRYYEQHRQWRRLPSAGQLAIVQDIASGGLLSGGILDMIAVKHTPLRSIASSRLSEDKLRGVRMAVNVDPGALSPEQAAALKSFTRRGGTLLTAPPGWSFPPQRPDQITLDKKDVEILDTIWKEVNSMTGRRNLGVRLFNVSSILSNLLELPGGDGPDGKGLVLHLLNCSDYPVESVTAHFLGKFTRAELHQPGADVRTLPVFEVMEGTGVEIDQIRYAATLVVH